MCTYKPSACALRLLIVASQTCEDLEDAENLRHLFHIMRGAIMLNDTSLLETLLAEDAVMVRPFRIERYGDAAK